MYVHEVLRYNTMKKTQTKTNFKEYKRKKNSIKNQQKTNEQKHKGDYRAPIIIERLSATESSHIYMYLLQNTKQNKNKVQKYHTVGTVPNSNR